MKNRRQVLRNKTLTALWLLLAVLIFGLSSNVSAENSVTLGDPGCPLVDILTVTGDSVGIPIYLTNDTALGGLTLGFIFNSTDPASTIKPTSFDFTNSVLPLATSFGNQKYLPDASHPDHAPAALVGWADFTGTNSLTPQQGGLMGTLWVQVPLGSGAQCVGIDSGFVPPAGMWLFSPTMGNGFTADFHDACVNDDMAILKPQGCQSVLHEFETLTLPETYSIDQNVPNPFNPNTYIDFALPRSADVTLEVFNVLGQKVAVLVDEHLAAGFKRVEWDGLDFSGNEVASGLYLYRIQANDFTETKKMMLLK